MVTHQLYELLYGPNSLNLRLFLAINHAHVPLLDTLMPLLTRLGDFRVEYFYLFVLTGIFFWRRTIMPARNLVVFCVASVISMSAEALLKWFFAIPRPAAAIGLAQVRVLGELKLYDSLPSGHAVVAFMAATVISHGRGWRWRLPLFMLAVLVAYSRVYMGAHYPLDVLVGALVGTSCGILVWKGYEALERGRGRERLP